jgi:hypothetical protein
MPSFRGRLGKILIISSNHPNIFGFLPLESEGFQELLTPVFGNNPMKLAQSYSESGLAHHLKHG